MHTFEFEKRSGISESQKKGSVLFRHSSDFSGNVIISEVDPDGNKTSSIYVPEDAILEFVAARAGSKRIREIELASTSKLTDEGAEIGQDVVQKWTYTDWVTRKTHTLTTKDTFTIEVYDENSSLHTSSWRVSGPGFGYSDLHRDATVACITSAPGSYFSPHGETTAYEAGEVVDFCIGSVVGLIAEQKRKNVAVPVPPSA